MSITVYVTLDLFFRDWHDQRAGELWLCIQPHVEGVADLATWLENTHSSAGRTYTFRDAADDCPNPGADHDYYPVNFESDTDLDVELLTVVDGGEVPVLSPMRNERTTALKILSADALRLANVQKLQSGKLHSGKDTLQHPLEHVPFARAYNQSLNDAKLGAKRGTATTPQTGDVRAATTDELASMLQLAFWGGTRRELPPGSVSDLGAVALMRHPGPGSNVVTNLHSLNGLLFLIGRRSQLGDLKRVQRIRVNRSVGGTSVPIAFRDPVKAQKSFTAFFGRLDTTTSDPAAQNPKAAPLRDIESRAMDRRVYVRDSPVPFNFALVNEKAWFLRRRESTERGELFTPATLRRLVVRLKEETPGMPPTAADYTSLRNLEWQPYRTYEAYLVPYRRFPARTELGGMPLRLMPAESSRNAFYGELAQGENCLRDAIVVDGAGKKLAVEFLGCFDFEWDKIDATTGERDGDVRTFLYFGKQPEPNTVMVAFGRNAYTASSRLRTTFVDDAWGARLELDPSAVGVPTSEVFDALACVNPPDAAMAARLVPAGAFKDFVDFEFAQAATLADELVEVKYQPYTCPGQPEQVHPEQELLSDLVNYNAVKANFRWPGSATEFDVNVNEHGQLLPVGSVQSPAVRHYFRIAHRYWTRTPRPDTEVAEEVPAHFEALFVAMTNETKRQLSLDLEHTYGVRLGGYSLPPLRSFADFPVTSPTSVRIQQKGPNDKPDDVCQGVPHAPLLSVSYDKSSCGTASECAVLAFNVRLLEKETFKGKCRGTYIDAWRSIAELANAESVKLRGSFFLFDFRAGFGPEGPDGGEEAKGARYADALTLVTGSEAWESDITAVVKATCAKWLHDRAPSGAAGLPVPLPPLNGVAIGKACNVMALSIEIARKRSVTPPEEVDWVLVRPTPDPDPIEGRRVEAVPQSISAFKDVWLPSLSRSVAYLQSADAEDDREAAFRRMIGDKNDVDSSTWIFPTLDSPPPPGEVVPSICPVTFLPLKRDGYLGDLTSTLVRRYFRMLQTVLELGAPGTWDTWTATQWKDHFVQLAGQNLSLGVLFTKLRDLVYPIPNPDAAVSDEARLLINSLLARNVHALPVEVDNWIEKQIWIQPGLFDDAKALLVTRLRGAESQESVIPGEFYQLISHKLIREVEVASRDAESVMARDRIAYRQGLAALRNSPWFGFVEVLDDRRYDNEFQFAGFGLRSYEEMVEQAEQPAGQESTKRIRLENQKLHLPAGAQEIPETPPPTTVPPMVRLTSRETLVPPVHAITTMIEACQAANWPDPWLPDARTNEERPLSLNALRKGVFEPPAAGEPVAIMESASDRFLRSERRDDYVLTSIFSVFGDEEIDDGNKENAFQNDDFEVALIVDPILAEAGVPPAPIDDAVKAAFDELNKAVAPTYLNRPEQFVSSTVLAWVASKLEPVSDLDTNNLTNQTIQRKYEFAIVEAATGFEVKFDGASHEGVEAALFRVESDQTQTSSPRPAGFLLLVNIETSVWRPASIAVVQKRNADADFALKFRQTSPKVSDISLYQAAKQDDLSKEPPVVLPERTLSPAQLVNLLVLRNSPETMRADHTWRDFDLSISVFHRQRTMIRAFTPAHDAIVPGCAEMLKRSPFPLKTMFVKALSDQQDATYQWFPDEHDEFVVEFLWSSPTNLPFFQIRNAFAQVKVPPCPPSVS